MYHTLTKFRDVQRLIGALEERQSALKVGTMCSGTDSPILALSAFQYCEFIYRQTSFLPLTVFSLQTPRSGFPFPSCF